VTSFRSAQAPRVRCYRPSRQPNPRGTFAIGTPTDSELDAYRDAIASLDSAGIGVRYRRRSIGYARELDIWLSRDDVAATDAVLGRLGFVALTAPGSGRHRFYVRFSNRSWAKIDAKLDPRRRRRVEALERSRAVIGRTIGRRLPASTRRLGPVVAVLGPDGAGKGTVIDRLCADIPIGVTVVYFGTRTPATTTARRPPSQAGTVKETLFVLRKYLRALRRMLRAYAAAWRGHIVLCDRHPLEVLAIEPIRAPVAGRVERALAKSLVPAPDAIIVLDAPVDVLRARKQEQPAEVLERWRRRYGDVFGASATIISSETSIEATINDTSAVVWQAFLARRRRNRGARSSGGKAAEGRSVDE
jgi:thymidylate kinase